MYLHTCVFKSYSTIRMPGMWAPAVGVIPRLRTAICGSNILAIPQLLKFIWDQSGRLAVTKLVKPSSPSSLSSFWSFFFNIWYILMHWFYNKPTVMCHFILDHSSFGINHVSFFHLFSLILVFVMCSPMWNWSLLVFSHLNSQARRLHILYNCWFYSLLYSYSAAANCHVRGNYYYYNNL